VINKIIQLEILSQRPSLILKWSFFSEVDIWGGKWCDCLGTQVLETPILVAAWFEYQNGHFAASWSRWFPDK